ncbi:DUF2188 domain-containing protein [Pseudonocardia sp. ICBG601]|uniref:DUF2188 domain-containing protein n=1 Tax=Pseudonocardia sp. ICBG601 TaxID=2846759 RepID=UPI0021F5E33D|nr:DUF2188 domain-containing protein [Pseudonocardia sp. ICBG601]
MADRHVKPVDDGWTVEKEDARRPSARTSTQAEAITRAVEIIANDGGGLLVVHGTDGSVRERRSIEPDADAGTATKAKPPRAATATAVKDTASKAADTTGKAADSIGSDTRTTAKKVAGETGDGVSKAADAVKEGADTVAAEARKVNTNGKAPKNAGKAAARAAKATGEQLAGTAERTGKQVAGEARASAERSAETVKAVADQGAESAVRTADRAARVSARVEDDLDDQGARLARRLYENGERAASQLDDFALRVYKPLNPIRFTSRVAAGAVATAFGVTGAVTARAQASCSSAGPTRPPAAESPQYHDGAPADLVGGGIVVCGSGRRAQHVVAGVVAHSISMRSRARAAFAKDRKLPKP